MHRPPRARLDPGSRERVNTFYTSALERFGPAHPLAVWWASVRAQERRFEVLCEAGPWEGASVADVGCGLGDLFGFLESRGLTVRYEGYDINPRMLAAARAKHRSPRARFSLRDVVASGFPRRYDYVVASGTFNVRVRGHGAYVRRAVETMYAACRRAVAFNVLTPIPEGHPDREFNDRMYGGTFYHTHLEPLAAWCRRRAREVEVREGYRDWDATILMLR
jgi:SAM-dependent methyltransferase